MSGCSEQKKIGTSLGITTKTNLCLRWCYRLLINVFKTTGLSIENSLLLLLVIAFVFLTLHFILPSIKYFSIPEMILTKLRWISTRLTSISYFWMEFHPILWLNRLKWLKKTHPHDSWHMTASFDRIHTIWNCARNFIEIFHQTEFDFWDIISLTFLWLKIIAVLVSTLLLRHHCVVDVNGIHCDCLKNVRRFCPRKIIYFTKFLILSILCSNPITQNYSNQFKLNWYLCGREWIVHFFSSSKYSMLQSQRTVISIACYRLSQCS